jgi:hypothetical protein
MYGLQKKLIQAVKASIQLKPGKHLDNSRKKIVKNSIFDYLK